MYLNILIERKEKEFELQVEMHKLLVIYAYNNFLIPVIHNDLPFLIDELIAAKPLVLRHDDSKYSDAEFVPYRRSRYPTDIEKADKAWVKETEHMYNIARQHHLSVNPHHLEYWINNDGTIEDIPWKYIIEMVCDWWAVSAETNDSVINWWNSTEMKQNRRNNMTETSIQRLYLLLYKIINSTYIPLQHWI